MRRLLLPLLVLAGLLGPVRAQDGEEPAPEPTRCACEHRNACYHFLNAPVTAPDDPCSCPRCAAGQAHEGGVPDGWNEACVASNRLACFLKRHAASWRITCSACLANHTCCPYPHQDTCPECGDVQHDDLFAKDALRQDARATMETQLAIERRFFDEKKVVVAYSRRFYVVTDIDEIRIGDQQDGFRLASGHEYAHLMVQRCELAYDELSRLLGGRIKLLRPMGVYLPKSEKDGRALQDVYFRNARNHMIYSSYAGRSESAISEGFCLNGFCVPLERVKPQAAATRSLAGEDRAWHGSVRHLMAHVLTTCWIVRNGENRTMPRWAFVGAAHWFCKRVPKLEPVVYYCTGEKGRISGSGRDWRELLRKRALAGDLRPIEELLGMSDLGKLDLDDHRQVWGVFDVAMESPDWHDPWVALLADLRDEVDVREAFQRRLGMTPEAFQEAWVARLLGRDVDEAPPTEAPSAARIDPMGTPAEIAAGLRALGKVADPVEVGRVLDLIGLVQSDLVRETGLQALLKVEDPAARRAVWEQGLASARPLTRAYAARACRLLGLTDAKEALRALLDDPHWLVRSDAALACAALRDLDAQSGLRKLTGDPSPKVRIGAMDALALLGEDVNSVCLPLVARNLAHERWQVQVAAAQCLARIGDHEVVTALIEQAGKEGGRVQEECFAALRAISHEDMGNDADRWRRWWDLERPHAEERGGFVVTGPRPPPETPGRYAPDDAPTYYGEKVFSQRVVFVLDTSRSTNRNFRPSELTRRRLLGDYAAETSTINDLTRAEITRGIEQLDPRARFNVVCFASDVATWQRGLVAASEGNKRSAASFARSRAPDGETNFHGALLAALEIDRDRPWASPDPTESADTVNFLTDGSPTTGDVTDPEQVIRWFVELNRYSRARVNVFVFGTLGVNETFLQRLAACGGGVFTQLYEENPR